jgi:hypothetical protein
MYWIGYAGAVSAPAELAATLTEVAPNEYVRFVADWLLRADRLNQAPGLTGIEEIDALVAAATAHVAGQRGESAPDWTEEPTRFSASFWYPGPDALFPNALVHSPLAFLLHGVLVESDSLVSV